MEDGGVGEHTVHVSSRCVRGASEKFFWSACWALAEGLGHLGGWEESQRNLYFRKKKGAREGFAEPTKKVELDKKEAKRGFFRPIIIVHIVVSVLLALMIVALALAYPYLT